MTEYLAIDVGDMGNTRGRAFIYVKEQTRADARYLPKLVDINTTSLREAIDTELYEGRLIAQDILDPYAVFLPFSKTMAYPELLEYARQEKLDLLAVQVSGTGQIAVEAAVEQTVARYTTVCRENIYLRSVQSLADEVFRLRKKFSHQDYYVGLYRLAYWIGRITRAMRKEDELDLDWSREQMQEMYRDIPAIDVKRIAQIMEGRQGSEWVEMATYLDSFYLTLKKHYPLMLNGGNSLSVKKESLAWLEEGFPAQLEEYFLAVLSEQYEKAIELKQILGHSHSKSLRG